MVCTVTKHLSMKDQQKNNEQFRVCLHNAKMQELAHSINPTATIIALKK